MYNKKVKGKKGAAAVMIGGAMILFVVIVAGVLVSSWLLTKGGDTPLMAGGTSGSDAAKLSGIWKESVVYFKYTVKNRYNATSLNPTVKVFHEKPTDWGIATGSFETDDPKYEDQFTGSNGSVSLNTLKPGHYWTVITLSSYNTMFHEVDVPDGPRSSEETLSTYNSEPQTDTIKMAYSDALSVADQSLGTLTNTTTKQTYTVYQTLTVDQDQEYCLDYVTFKEPSANASFSNDDDSDGEYDEGVEYIKVTINPMNSDKQSKVMFDVDKSIDEFSGDNEWNMDFDAVVIKSENTITITYEVESDKGTNSTTADKDEYLGEGENFLDLIFVDCMGTTATINLSG